MQVATSITLFLGHLRWKDTTGKLILINLQQLQIEIGSDTNALELNYEKWRYFTTKSWLKCIWHRLSDHNMALKGSDFWVPTSLRMHERGIMDLLVDTFTIKDLREINAVRLYLKVIYPSDVCNAAGTKIRAALLQGKRDDMVSDHKFQFPNQKRPKMEWIASWTRAMRYIQETYLPMQGWWREESAHDREWHWWINKEENVVYKRERATWSRHEQGQYGRYLAHGAEQQERPEPGGGRAYRHREQGQV